MDCAHIHLYRNRPLLLGTQLLALINHILAHSFVTRRLCTCNTLLLRGGVAHLTGQTNIDSLLMLPNTPNRLAAKPECILWTTLMHCNHGTLFFLYCALPNKLQVHTWSSFPGAWVVQTPTQNCQAHCQGLSPFGRTFAYSHGCHDIQWRIVPHCDYVTHCNNNERLSNEALWSTWQIV